VLSIVRLDDLIEYLAEAPGQQELVQHISQYRLEFGVG